MNNRLGAWSIFLGFLVSFSAMGCGPGTDNPKTDAPKPKVTKIQKQSFAIGEEFTLQGKNFVTENGRTQLHFRGEFLASDGSSKPVDFKVPLAVEPTEAGNKQKGKWLRFGPFGNPFTNEPKTGEFVGTVTAINEYFPQKEGEGTRILRGEPENTSIRVEPSIEIVGLQPKGADCGAPALRGLPGMEYKLKVRAVGFAPTKFEYRISSIKKEKGLGDYKHFEHQATGPTDTVGDGKGEKIVFQAVPPGTKYYVAGVEVRAKDRATGKWVHTALPYSIHRPIEVDYISDFEVAQHYQPKPVTACIPGAINNRATYSEEETQVKQRTASIGISQDWSKSNMNSNTKNWRAGYSVTDTKSRTKTLERSKSKTETNARTSSDSYNKSRQNSFQRSTSKGERWHHENEAGVKASTEVDVPLIGGAEVEGHYDRRWGKATTKERERSFGKTIDVGRSQSFSKSYTLANSVSSSRSRSDTESRSKSRTYNYGAAATSSKRVTQGISKAEEKTWMESKSSSTLTQFSGFIPVEKYGVFYRQTIRMVRRATLTSYNKCGVGKHMGEIQLNTWNWAPDLAVGESCDTALPKSNLPPAKCHIKPCE